MVNLAEWLQLAAAEQRAGDSDAAERALRQALSLAPRDARIRRELAWLLFRRGNREAGIDELRRATAEAPSAPLHNDLGMMLREAGHLDEAVASFQEAIRVDPALWQAQFNLGNAHRRRGQHAQAAQHYHAAARQAPDDPDVLVSLGVTQKLLGELDAARSNLERALQIQPGNVSAWISLGNVCQATGNVEKAIDCYRRAQKVGPQNAIAHNDVGLALYGVNQLAAAIDSFERTVRHDPNYGPPRVNLGNAYESQGETSAARDCFAEALRLTGDDAMKIKRALTLPVIIDSAEQIELVRRQLADELDALSGESLSVDDPVQSIGAPAFALAYHGRNERQTQAQIASILRHAVPALAFVAPHCAAPRGPRPARRLKIGFVSTHFRTHTIGKLNAGVIEQLNREAFEVFVVSLPRADDEMYRRIADAADTCVTLPTGLADARHQIAKLELDVLYYTDIGIDPLTYYLACARLAPVQCVTWGHPLTTGIPTLDYFISSEQLEPAGSESHYTEKLVRLPHLANYYDRPDLSASTKTRHDFGLAGDAHLYACLQSLFKLHPDDDENFAAILRRDPRGILMLREGNFPRWTELARRRFRRSMPDVCDRIQFISYQEPWDFLRLLAAVDVLLDPLHFGGGDTSYQSFAVGGPIVTLPSGFLRGRITYSLYRAMGIDDLIADDRDDYVDLAVRLANDPAWRDQIRSKILASGETIFENPAGVRDLEAFLIEAVKEQLAP